MRSSSWCSPLRLLHVSRSECGERHPHHLRAALSHVDEALDDCLPRAQVARELRQLGDRHALVTDALDVQPRVEDREDETKIACYRRLACKHHLDLPFEGEIAFVDLIVERDDLVAQLDILCSQGVDRATDRAEDDLAGLLKRGLERVELRLQPNSHPNRPVT